MLTGRKAIDSGRRSMKSPFATIGYPVIFLLSGIAVAELLASADIAASPEEPPVPRQIPAASEFPLAAAAAVPPDVAVDPSHADRVRTVIRQHSPDASPEIVDVLVEEYQDFDIDSIAFMMQQRRQSGVVLPASLTSDWTGSERTEVPSDALPGEVAQNEWLKAIATARQQIRSNLLCVTTPGYRRRVVLVDIAETRVSADSPIRSVSSSIVTSTPDSSSPRDSSESSYLRTAVRKIWSFVPGTTVPTNDPLHVKLPDDSNLMFSFGDGNTFSRRGDFRVLSNGTIGVAAPDRDMPLSGSPVIPADCAGLHIDRGGHIAGIDADGKPMQLGVISVVQLTNLRELTSSDGVFFRGPNQSSVKVVNPQHLRVEPGMLELSNVDRQHEWSDLEHIQRVQSEFRSNSAVDPIPTW
jgi:flagellar basal body rod protein FlgG